MVTVRSGKKVVRAGARKRHWMAAAAGKSPFGLKHKFRAQPTEKDGFRYDSKLEAKYADWLNLRIRAGEVIGYLRQVPFHLPGKTKYVVDFQVFEADGTVRFVDCKGVETEVFKLKMRQMKQFYPWVDIEIVRKV